MKKCMGLCRRLSRGNLLVFFNGKNAYFYKMAIPKQTPKFTAAEYLQREATAEIKSEFHDGEILAMSGGTFEHSLIISNCNAAIKNAISSKGCFVFDSNLKVKAEKTNSYLYPDVTVICGKVEADPLSNHVALNPVLIVEVISETTGAYDRGEKFHNYQNIHSFREYVLVEQKKPQVDVLYKNASGDWMLKSYFGLDGNVELQSLGIFISLSTIYECIEDIAG